MVSKTAFAKRAYQVRGELISRTIHLERLMDDFLCKHFCNNHRDRKLLMELIAERMEFSQKAAGIEKILRTMCQQEGKDFSKQYKGFAKDFQDLAKSRNAFAHKFDIIPYSEEDRKKYLIVFITYKDKTDYLHYTHEMVTELNDNISKYIELFANLNR